MGEERAKAVHNSSRVETSTVDTSTQQALHSTRSLLHNAALQCAQKRTPHCSPAASLHLGARQLPRPPILCILSTTSLQSQRTHTASAALHTTLPQQHCTLHYHRTETHRWDLQTNEWMMGASQCEMVMGWGGVGWDEWARQGWVGKETEETDK